MNTVESFEQLQTLLHESRVLQRYRLARLGIFGSLARGDATPRDIDLYIDSDQISLEELLSLKRELEEKTGKPVDVVVKRYANPIVLYRAQGEMKYVT
jgi:hypothetical protein